MEINPNFSKKAHRDYKLVQAAKNGNQRAYTDLMSFYKNSVNYVINSMVENENDAEDLTIEAFGKAFRNIATYEPKYAFSTWLFRIAINNSIDFLRKKQVRLISIDEQNPQKCSSEPLSLQSVAPDPEEWLIIKQNKNTVLSFIEQLSPRYSQILKLRYISDLSVAEISEKLDIVPGTIKSRLFRARDLLLNTIRKDKNSDLLEMTNTSN